MNRKIANDFSPNTGPLCDNDPDRLQCYLLGDRFETAFTKSLKDKPLNVTISRKFSLNDNSLSDNDPDIDDYYSFDVKQEIKKGIENLGMIGSKSKRIKSRFHDLSPKSMSKNKRRNAYAK